MLRLLTNLRSGAASPYRLLSTSPPEAPPAPPTSSFAVEYLVGSCGLPYDRALRAARYVPHLKAPDKPDAVLRFLRQSGVTEPHIRGAALRYPAFLCFNLDKCLKPRINELLEIGFSPSQISLLLSICPTVFKYTNLQERVQIWMPQFGSVDKLLNALKHNFYLLACSLERTSANLSFLQQQCGLSFCQIAQLLRYSSRSITCSPESLKINVKRAEELGVPCSSGMFIFALKVVSERNPSIIDVRIRHLRQLGLSQEEVATLVRKNPIVLTLPEGNVSRKIEFLLKEAGCDKLQVVQIPSLVTCSLEKRLRPRSLVRKVLLLKGLLVTNIKFASFIVPTEEQFLKRYILPYENIIPGLHEAYKDVCAGSTERIDWFNSISS